MPSEAHRKLKVTLTDFDFDTNFAEIDSVATGDMVWSAPVTDCEDCYLVEVFAEIKSGTSPDGYVEFYVGRSDDGTTPEIRVGNDGNTTTDHGEETTTASVDRMKAALDGPLEVIYMDTSDTDYEVSFFIENPGAEFNLFIANESGAALNGTASPHTVRYRGWVYEAQ